MMRGRDMRRRRYERTHDRVMGVGEYSPIPTISVNVFDVVSSGAIGVDGGGLRHDRRPDQKDSKLGGSRWLGLPIKEGVKLRQLQLDGGQGGIHLRLPLGEALVEWSGCWLKRNDMLLPLVLGWLKLREACVDDGVVLGETLADVLAHLVMHLRDQFLDEKLDVGIHGS
jgi:hypothetical protein